MANRAIRISQTAYAKLRELAKQEQIPLTEVFERAIDAYYRRRFLETVNESFARLKTAPKAWAQELAERVEWNCTLLDGLTACGRRSG